jgi:vacuolar-type H+-ATPase subunit I/STV1
MKLGKSFRIAAVALALAAGPASADDYQDAVDRAHAELDKFQTWMGQQIDTLQQEIAKLQEEAEGSDAAAKDRIDEMIDHAVKLADDLREEAKQIGEASSEQWEGVKASALSGWHRVQPAYYAALAELRRDRGSDG